MFSSRGFLKISQNIICRNGLKNSVRSTHIKTEYGNWGIPRKVIEHLMKKYPNAFIEQKTLYVGLNSDPFHVTKGGMELLNKGLEMTTMIDGE